MSDNSNTELDNLIGKAMVIEKNEPMSLRDYFGGCKNGEKELYTSAADRMFKAMGKPEIFDTSKDERMGLIFMNRKIKIFKTFNKFYGMESVIEDISDFYGAASRGEGAGEKVLYFLGPVGCGKSSLVRRLKELFEEEPIYVLRAGDVLSPLFESPLGLLASSKEEEVEKHAAALGIDPRYIPRTPSPWALKRLYEFGGDKSQFSVVKMYPSALRRVAISVTEPSDENNQDVSTLIGKIDITKLGRGISQSDPDAYSFSGGLNTTTQGIMEFVEMFKAPLKTLNPLLQATTEHAYEASERFASKNPNEGYGALPYNGLIIAHSNEAEWSKFKNNRDNEAFIDRIQTVKVPYVLRYTEEMKIYEQYIQGTDRRNVDKITKKNNIAPGTLEILAKFAAFTRLKDHENSSLSSKIRVYNGDNVKDTDPKAKPIHEYKEAAGIDEGMTGLSPRLSFRIISETFTYDPSNEASNPIYLFRILEKIIKKEQLGEDADKNWLGFLNGPLMDDYFDFIQKELQTAYVGKYSEYGQNLFENYVNYADHWVRGVEYPDTSGQMMSIKLLDAELSSLEKPAGISNPKDFRNEIVMWVLRKQRESEGKMPRWTAYRKLKDVIEKKMFKSMEDMLPVIKFGTKESKDDEEKHESFVDRMVERGYTKTDVEVLVNAHMRRKNS